MKSILDIEAYKVDLEQIAGFTLPWEKLRGKRVMISGATGMIGKTLIDALMLKNAKDRLDCKIIAMGRSEAKAKGRFPGYFKRADFEFLECDIESEIKYKEKIDYVLHLASSTHPKQYASEPVKTITGNVIGLKNLLDFAVNNGAERFLFASSVEIYGENRGDAEKFDEKYLGYIDCNTLRAGYPEGKRASEALCQAYRAQYGIEAVIPRLARVFGPTILPSDSKASSQFIQNAVNGEDIVLKSEGKQHYSYLHVRDAVIGLLVCLLNGVDGEAYNIADEKYDITLREMAETLAKIGGKKVIFDLPDESEKKGYSTATKAILEAEKIREIGFKAGNSIEEDLARTVEILRRLAF